MAVKVKHLKANVQCWLLPACQGKPGTSHWSFYLTYIWKGTDSGQLRILWDSAPHPRWVAIVPWGTLRSNMWSLYTALFLLELKAQLGSMASVKSRKKISYSPLLPSASNAAWILFSIFPILPLSFIPALTQIHTFTLFTHLLHRTTRIGGLKTAAKPMLTDTNWWFLKSPNVEIVSLLTTDGSRLWVAGLETSYQSSPDSWTLLTSGPLLGDGVWAGVLEKLWPLYIFRWASGEGTLELWCPTK